MKATLPDPRRPLVRYYGGKWRLAPWIIAHFPQHRIYVEPFGGGGSVLLRKPRSYAEVYNDLDGEMVNLFRVARDRGEDLARAVMLTPFAREEYNLSYVETDDPLEQARRTLLRSQAGFGSNSLARQVRSGFRGCVARSSTTPAGDWSGMPDVVAAVCQRLKGVVLENMDACALMQAHDGPNTLHYCDPPYVQSTRSMKAHGDHGYRHEMDDDAHRSLAAFLLTLTGAVVLSGYDCDLYRDLYAGWERYQIEALADGARKRTEVLWCNPGPETKGALL